MAIASNYVKYKWFALGEKETKDQMIGDSSLG